MRTFLIAGASGVQEVSFEDEDFGLYTRAVAGDVEAHNALNPNDLWSWGEKGTMSDPTLTDEQRAALAGQAQIDRISALSEEAQGIELKARLDGLASTADTMDRKAQIQGESFDPQAWYQQEAAKITVLYTKIVT